MTEELKAELKRMERFAERVILFADPADYVLLWCVIKEFHTKLGNHIEEKLRIEAENVKKSKRRSNRKSTSKFSSSRLARNKIKGMVENEESLLSNIFPIGQSTNDNLANSGVVSNEKLKILNFNLEEIQMLMLENYFRTIKLYLQD